MADQRELRQNVGLENMNMTSNYDVTNNTHQIQMTPYATEWKPHENFLRTSLVPTAYPADSRKAFCEVCKMQP